MSYWKFGSFTVALAGVAAVALLPVPAFAQYQTRDVSTFQSVAMPAGWSPEDNVLYAFVPNDPYYTTGNPATFPGQWHLNKQTSTAVVDTKVVGAWNRDLTGQGVLIGIVDDSMQINHPDLAPNHQAAHSRDFGQNDNDPSPVHPNNVNYGDNHGTSVAGVAAARGGNNLGGTGAAPHAGLAGLRIDFPNQTNQMFVDATLWHSSGNDTSIKIKNHSYGTSIPYSDRTSQVNATITSTNAGTIHVFAAGNERSAHGQFIDANGNGFFDPDIDFAVDGDANKKHMQSIQQTIDVAALASSGIHSSYSNWGSNIWVTAPSNSFRANELGITTTDRTGGAFATGGYNYQAGGGDGDGFPDLDYNSTFGGTSSAAPLVTGILALAKQAQPALNYRFAKHLLARTSDVVDAGDVTPTGGWVTNGAGLKFNNNYGFGLIDADELTSEAVKYSAVTPLVTETVPLTSVAAFIPDNSLAGISRNFNLTTPGQLEEVEVRLNVQHSWRGDVEALLTSPSGTVSRLMYRNPADSFNNINWTFVTNAFWGENPVGQWSLTVRDVISGISGTWTSFSVLAKTGGLVPVPEPTGILLALIGFIGFAAQGRRRG